MADGLKKNAKGEIEAFVVEGTEYPLGPFSPADFAEATNFLSAQRCKPMEALMRDFETTGKNPVLQQMLVDAAFKAARLNDSIDKVSTGDVIAWMQTHDGSTFVFWVRMRKNNKDLTLAKATEIVGKAFLADVDQREDAALKAV